MSSEFTIECTSCHAKFAGKPEYAGRRIRCPKCQEVFRVEETSPVEEVSQPIAAAPSALAEEFDEWNVPDDFEYKVQKADEGSDAKCRFCHEPLQSGQVLCMKCGFHQTLNKKFETKSGAEANFEDEKPKGVPGEISFGSFSLPTIPLAIAGGVLALFALAVLIIAPGIFALFCGLGGLILVTVGHFWIIIVAFREDVGQGLLVWLLPIYWWVYVFSRWEETWFGFAIWGAGCVLLFFAIGIFASLGGEESAAALVLHFA